ncbi:hypothetical protein Q5P01_012393 [Channa striata]|uniref:Uncharacterized protein n=1 Tax=Channa striata TaxID=64152 RepID=A0AA88MSH0_CHASR|nr:hypothetical protein Q5P01_012393 [Channa striata]
MHGLPCSSLGHCFGNPPDVNSDPGPSHEPHSSRQSRNNHGLSGADPVICQPEPRPRILKEQQRTVSSTSTCSDRIKKVNGTNSDSVQQDKVDDPCSESPPSCHSFSQSSEDDGLETESCSPELQLKYPQIPRPSIVIRQPKQSEFQETVSDRSDCRGTEDGGLSGTENNTSFLLFFLTAPIFPSSSSTLELSGTDFQMEKVLA